MYRPNVCNFKYLPHVNIIFCLQSKDFYLIRGELRLYIYFTKLTHNHQLHSIVGVKISEFSGYFLIRSKSCSALTHTQKQHNQLTHFRQMGFTRNRILRVKKTITAAIEKKTLGSVSIKILLDLSCTKNSSPNDFYVRISTSLYTYLFLYSFIIVDPFFNHII